METNPFIRLADVLQVIKSERQDASGNVALTPAGTPHGAGDVQRHRAHLESHCRTLLGRA